MKTIFTKNKEFLKGRIMKKIEEKID